MMVIFRYTLHDHGMCSNMYPGKVVDITQSGITKHVHNAELVMCMLWLKQEFRRFRIICFSGLALHYNTTMLKHCNPVLKGGGKMLQIDMLVELTESNAANTTVSERGRAGTLSNP